MKNKVIAGLCCLMGIGLLFGGCGLKGVPTTTTPKVQESGVGADETNLVAEVESGHETEGREEVSQTSLVFYKGNIEERYFTVMEQGIKKAAKELGISEIPVISMEDQGLQDVIKEEEVKEKRGVAFYIEDPNAEMETLQEGQLSGIPIIGAGVDLTDDVKGLVAANANAGEYAMGQLAATNTYAQLEDQIKDAQGTIRLAVISQDPFHGEIHQRTRGFLDKMSELAGIGTTSIEGDERYNNQVEEAKVIIDVVSPLAPKKEGEEEQALGSLHGEPEFDEKSMTAKIKEEMGKQDLIGIFATSEQAADCLLNVNKQGNRLGADKVLGIGFESGAKQKEAIREGIFAGAVAKNYEQIGYKAIMLAAAAAKGEAVKNVDTGAIWYDSNNIDTPELEAYLYE